MKVCCSPAAVQFCLQFVILTVHFDSFRIEVNGVFEFLFSIFFIAIIIINLCNCYSTTKEYV